MKDLNATAAALRAGYSEKTAHNIGSELLGKTVVQSAIELAKKERRRRANISSAWVLKRLRKEAGYHGEGASHAARVKALQLIGQHVGFFPARKVEHTGANGGAIQLEIAALSDDELDRRITDAQARLARLSTRAG